MAFPAFTLKPRSEQQQCFMNEEGELDYVGEGASLCPLEGLLVTPGSLINSDPA